MYFAPTVFNQMKVLIVFGTRPEAIKLAPLIVELQNNSDFFKVCVCVTAQHRDAGSGAETFQYSSRY